MGLPGPHHRGPEAGPRVVLGPRRGRTPAAVARDAAPDREEAQAAVRPEPAGRRLGGAPLRRPRPGVRVRAGLPGRHRHGRGPGRGRRRLRRPGGRDRRQRARDWSPSGRRPTATRAGPPTSRRGSWSDCPPTRRTSPTTASDDAGAVDVDELEVFSVQFEGTLATARLGADRMDLFTRMRMGEGVHGLRGRVRRRRRGPADWQDRLRDDGSGGRGRTCPGPGPAVRRVPMTGADGLLAAVAGGRGLAARGRRPVGTGPAGRGARACRGRPAAARARAGRLGADLDRGHRSPGRARSGRRGRPARLRPDPGARRRPADRPWLPRLRPADGGRTRLGPVHVARQLDGWSHRDPPRRAAPRPGVRAGAGLAGPAAEAARPDARAHEVDPRQHGADRAVVGHRDRARAWSGWPARRSPGAATASCSG